MSRRRVASAFLLFLFAAALGAAEKPALVVVISVDQMRNDYLDRFRPWFGRDGFNRFLERGARYPEARHRHATTATCPGHTAIGTGLDPRETGIVGNTWYDTVQARQQTCVEDRSARWVGAPPGVPPTATALFPASPVLIGGDFLGDRFKEKFPGGRVVSLSLKDRAAVPMGGRKADAVLWFVDAFKRFATSSYYPATPLLSFNERLPAFFASHRRWELSGRIPEKDLSRVAFDPPELLRFKGSVAGTGDRFPHALPNPQNVIESPFGDELVLELARYAIRELRLGRNPARAPDLLFLGLTSLDYYGHRFGPDSREVADGIVRLDGLLEAFLHWLDGEVGARSMLLFLTSDHGVTPIPEVARERARRATGRDDPRVAGRLDLGNGVGAAAKVAESSPARVALEKHLAAKFGYSLDLTLPNALEGAVLRFEEPIGLYLNRAVLARRRLAPEKVKEAVRDWLRGRPGVRGAWTNTEIGDGLPATEPLALPIERAFRADRSPDVGVYLRPGWIFRKEPGSTHGEPTDADSRVPLLAWGSGVRPGSWSIRVSPLSIARTVAALYGFEAGARDAEVLAPVLGRDEEVRSPATRP
ncbi:MAG TPA: alkaline phosphatase family protein [Thermoanaerobaculia bacterium]